MAQSQEGLATALTKWRRQAYAELKTAWHTLVLKIQRSMDDVFYMSLCTCTMEYVFYK